MGSGEVTSDLVRQSRTEDSLSEPNVSEPAGRWLSGQKK